MKHLILIACLFAAAGCTFGGATVDQPIPQPPACDAGAQVVADAGVADAALARCDAPRGESDCPHYRNLCWSVTCSFSGVCEERPYAAGSSLPVEPAGACEVLTCDGAGNVLSSWVPAGTPCTLGGDAGRGTCNANGVCLP
jgi:hypothetical protein